MEKLKNLCGQIPEELHNKVRTEQESLGLTLGKYLEQVLTAHFAAPAPPSAEATGRWPSRCRRSFSSGSSSIWRPTSPSLKRHL